MKESEAREIIEHILIALTRFRGMAAEAGWDNDITCELMPWSLGQSNALRAAELMSDPKRPLSPMEFHNLIMIAHSLAPEIAVAVQTVRGVSLPDPDLMWLKGWEPESEGISNGTEPA